jgi:hypothetical protein
MDCVTCEKCRLWGKIQILGFGTAIKILLTPEEELEASCQASSARRLLNRQEIIALLNTLNQLSKSIEFVANINAETRLLEAATRRVVEVVKEGGGKGEVLSREEVIEEVVTEVTTTTSFTSEEVDTTSIAASEDLSSSDSSSLETTAVLDDVVVTVSEEAVVVQTPVAAKEIPEVNTRWYAKPNSTYASGTVPSRNKVGSDHSPEYRTALLGVFAAFVAFGFALLLYSTYKHTKND